MVALWFLQVSSGGTIRLKVAPLSVTTVHSLTLLQLFVSTLKHESVQAQWSRLFLELV